MHRVFIPHPKKWEDIQCCYSLGHSIACHSFNQGSSVSHHIHLQLGKLKFLTQTKSFFGNVFNTNILHFTRWSGRGLWFSGIPCGDVIGYRSKFDNMRNKEVEPFFFVLFIQTSITLFLKLLTHYFFQLH